MRSYAAAFLFSLLAGSASAQVTLVAEDFESGTLGLDWLWTGSTPVMSSPGYGSNWCVSKESADLSSPPFADPNNQLSVLFHPLTYDPNVFYSATAMMRVDDPMSSGATGWIYIGWIDGLNPTVDGLCTGMGLTAPTWMGNYNGTSSECGNMLGPNAVFGVVFCMHAGSQNCHIYLDNISVTSELATSIAGVPAAAPIAIMQMPGGAVQVSFGPGELPDVMTVHDAQGRLLRTYPINGSRSLQLQLAALPDGILLIRTTGAAGARTLRFLKS